MDNFIDANLIRIDLKNHRIASKMTQEQLANASGLSVSTISSLEAGRQSPTLETILKYISPLGLTLYIGTKSNK